MKSILSKQTTFLQNLTFYIYNVCNTLIMSENLHCFYYPQYSIHYTIEQATNQIFNVGESWRSGKHIPSRSSKRTPGTSQVNSLLLDTQHIMISGPFNHDIPASGAWTQSRWKPPSPTRVGLSPCRSIEATEAAQHTATTRRVMACV